MPTEGAFRTDQNVLGQPRWVGFVCCLINPNIELWLTLILEIQDLYVCKPRSQTNTRRATNAYQAYHTMTHTKSPSRLGR